jgi:hypothetical protein
VRRDVDARRSAEEERTKCTISLGCGGQRPQADRTRGRGGRGAAPAGLPFGRGGLSTLRSQPVLSVLVVSGYHRRPVLVDTVAGQ